MDPKRDYGAERQLVEAFLSKHLDHEGVRSALSWLQTWLDSAAAGQAVAGQREMTRLSEHQVEPLSILVEAGALFLFSRWSPRKLPDDERLTFAIGHRVLSLAPREKCYGTLKGRSRYYCRRLGKVARREVGRRIRLTLALLLANIAEAISAQEDQQQQFALSLSKPFPQP